MFYLTTDESGIVNQSSTRNLDGGFECQYNVLEFENLYKIVNGELIDTCVSKFPIYPFTKLDKENMVWLDDRSVDQKAEDIKKERNTCLQQSDWTQLPDVPLSTKEAWAAYRQELRDITLQEGYPENVAWPTPPN
jgi:hypothetical protein